jgi:biopolymer transport protein ExbB/TolQ
LSDERPARNSTRGPTDPSLVVTGAVALGVTALFYLAVVQPLLGTRFGDLFGDRGWVPYVITFLSAWAGVVLVEKLRRLSRQRDALELELLPTRIGARITPDNAGDFVEHLSSLGPRRGGLLLQRIRRALQHFEARRDARELQSQLENQANTDADAVESSYAMVRVFIWAVPILGFIGTVVGIGAAVGGFSEAVGGAVDLEVMKESIGSVTSGLSVAFDTTLIALVLSIPIMFASSAVQKIEEGFLAEIEDYCDEHLLRRLDDGGRPERGDEAAIRAAVQEELAPHRAELQAWLERLGQIGEGITAHVVAGWEKIDEQLRLRQDRQQERLSDWASARQREASEELSETQRGLLREFRLSLEGMAAEARRLQEEGAHRIDEQLAGIERLHRRLVEEQAAAAETQSAQRSDLSAASEQLAHTLARVRTEAVDARDSGVRQLEQLGERAADLARGFESTQRELLSGTETQAGALRDSGERLAATLARLDGQLARIRSESEGQQIAASAQRREHDSSRDEARRRDAELRDAQHAALLRASEELAQTLAEVRSEAAAARSRIEDGVGDVGPELVARVESVGARLAEGFSGQLARLEALYDRVERVTSSAERRTARERLRDRFGRG